MAKKRNTAQIEEKIKNAENIIRSFAYGRDLDDAINYLKKHSPKSAALEEIKGFERSTLKVLNAYWRADQAREEKDTAELEKIAEFLNNYKQYGNRKEQLDEAAKILSEIPELQKSSEQIDAIRDMADEADKMEHIQEKQEVVQDKAPSMSDDEIIINGKSIAEYLDNDFKWTDIIGDGDNVKIVDAKDDEEANDIKANHRKWMELDAFRAHVDDAAFAKMSDKEKKDTLKEDIYTRFWSDVETMAAATAVERGEDEEAVRAKARRHEQVEISKNAYKASAAATKVRVMDKINKFMRNGKEKAGKMLSGIFNKVNAVSDRILGYTPLEFAQTLYGAFTHRRGATNAAVSVGTLAATGLAMYFATPAAIAGGVAALGTYGVYSALAQQRWTIWEKKHANWQAAKAKGDEKEIARWSGMNGYNNALKAIKANPKENEIYQQLKKNSKRFGLGSTLLVGAATPFIGAASLPLVRGLAAIVRVSGANVNSGYLFKKAKERNEEEQTEQSARDMKRARTWFGVSLFGSAVAEAAVFYSIADGLATDHALGVEQNPENVEQQVVEQKQVEVPAPAPKVAVPQEWNSNMAITERQWDTVHATGDFDEKYLHAYNIQQSDADAIVQADGTKMPVEEFVYKSDRIMSLAKAYPDGHGGLIAHMYDENHVEVFLKDGAWVYKDGTAVTSSDIAPECWGTPEEVAAFRALYKSVDCGDKVGKIDSGLFNNLYDKTLHGTGSNYMDIDKCKQVHFIAHKAVTKVAVPPVIDEPRVVDEPVVPPEEVKVDGNADDGSLIVNKARLGDTNTGKGGWGQLDKEALDHMKVGEKGDVPNSAVEGGAEKQPATGNGEQAFNAAMVKSKMGDRLG